MRKILRYKRIYLLILIPVSLLIISIAKNNVCFAENIYALNIYPWLSRIISLITNIFPFSLAELIVITLPIVLIIVFIRFIIHLIVYQEKRIDTLIKGFLNIGCFLSIVLFLFVLLAGINYYRAPFSQYSNYEVRDSTNEELFQLTEYLALQANELRAEVPNTDEDGVFSLSMNIFELADMVAEAFDKLEKDYPVLGNHYGRPKPILSSPLMSYTEITGIFFPFTMEANVNIDISDYSIPSTMAHELAHLRGFMREDEANFLSYLATMKSDNVEIQYSGTMLALINTGNALYYQDVNSYFSLRDKYSEGVLRDIQANNEYWQQYKDTVISTVSTKVNDTYLKANDQSDGVKSYGKMVDLLLAKFRKERLV